MSTVVSGKKKKPLRSNDVCPQQWGHLCCTNKEKKYIALSESTPLDRLQTHRNNNATNRQHPPERISKSK
jgi:hypothetical protein